MSAGPCRETPDAFPPAYLDDLKLHVRKHPCFTVNNLNRDFVDTRGFSVVFRRAGLPQVVAAFPFFAPYLQVALRADCNAFYLNPLELEGGSRVDPHVDRSLRGYCKDVSTPLAVSVLYVDVPPAMQGGQLVLARGKRTLAKVQPRAGLLVQFDGDLVHSVDRVDSAGKRLSLVCEQYLLDERELAEVPEYAIETRAKTY
jgi:hypothetical protein